MSKFRICKHPQLFAYTDESGNTGHNLFDPRQPYFWTGTLLTHSDIDTTSWAQHESWTATLGVNELHGNELGIGRINKIAESVLSFLETQQAQFVFTQIEKRYHAAARFSFIILDSDYNKAVSPLHNFASAFHRRMSLDIFAFLTYGEAKRFWSAYEICNLAEFVSILENLRLRIFECHPDERARQLLLDALAYAVSNASDVFRKKRADQDSPNLLALDLLLGGIHKVTGEHSKVVMFRHDEQKQFGRAMSEQFDMAKNVRGYAEPDTFMFRLERVERFVCPISLVPSHTSIGLQLIDLGIYLTSQYLLGTYRPREDHCSALTTYIVNNAILQVFTYEGLVETSTQDYEAIMAREFTPEELARAEEMRDLVEARRVCRMESGIR